MKRFKALDLVDRMHEELWTEGSLNYCTGGSDQKSPKEKEIQEGRMVV